MRRRDRDHRHPQPSQQFHGHTQRGKDERWGPEARAWRDHDRDELQRFRRQDHDDRSGAGGNVPGTERDRWPQNTYGSQEDHYRTRSDHMGDRDRGGYESDPGWRSRDQHRFGGERDGGAHWPSYGAGIGPMGQDRDAMFGPTMGPSGYDPRQRDTGYGYGARGWRDEAGAGGYGNERMGATPSFPAAGAPSFGPGGYAGKGPKSYARSDERIREDVCDALMDDDDVDASDIDVTVKAGIVTLTGTVPERWAKRRAEDVACNCRCVKDVKNDLRIQDHPTRDGQNASGPRNGEREHSIS